MCRQPRASETEGAARQCAGSRLTNVLSRPSGELGYEPEGGADQHAKGARLAFCCGHGRQPRAGEGERGARQHAEGRLTNFLLWPCADSLGQVTVKETHASMPKIA